MWPSLPFRSRRTRVDVTVPLNLYWHSVTYVRLTIPPPTSRPSLDRPTTQRISLWDDLERRSFYVRWPCPWCYTQGPPWRVDPWVPTWRSSVPVRPRGRPLSADFPRVRSGRDRVHVLPGRFDSRLSRGYRFHRMSSFSPDPLPTRTGTRWCLLFGRSLVWPTSRQGWRRDSSRGTVECTGTTITWLEDPKVSGTTLTQQETIFSDSYSTRNDFLRWNSTIVDLKLMYVFEMWKWGSV